MVSFLNNKLAIVLAACAVLGGCGKMDSGRWFGPGQASIICKVGCNDTKGSTITTAGALTHATASEALSVNGFVLSAYAEEPYYTDLLMGDIHEVDPTPAGLYFKNSVSFSDDAWTIAGQPCWLHNIPITFWSWNTAAEGLMSGGNLSVSPYVLGSGELAFSYALPASTAAASSQEDATNQKDIIFAYNSEKRVYDEEGKLADDEMEIHFYHALSEVLFAISPDDGKYNKDIVLKSICIKNVHSSGDCVFTGAYGSAGFDWTPSGESNFSYAQDYNADFSAFDIEAPQAVLSGWQRGTYNDSSTSPSTKRSIYSCNNKFFMIPQTLGPDAVVSVTFNVEGVEMTREMSIYDAVNTDDNIWMPGYYYKYKINFTAMGPDIRFGIQLVDWDALDVYMEI